MALRKLPIMKKPFSCKEALSSEEASASLNASSPATLIQSASSDEADSVGITPALKTASAASVANYPK